MSFKLCEQGGTHLGHVVNRSQAPVQVHGHGREHKPGTAPQGRGYICTLLTCRKWLEIVTIFELSTFIQEVLWIKLLWIRKFLVVK